MPLSPGTRIGGYEIVSSLGAGGMGEVYRAKDSKLKRDVALKVLPSEVATDRERLARFQREAEVLASLNHPHIAQIHGLEESGGTTALVMELVDGEDLSQRIERGAIPIAEALPIAKQILEAIEAAHERGVIHRDLKPANIKLQQDGGVKVLDFGLAKAVETDDAHSSFLQTITSPAMTMAGVIIGTAAYMAPEQAKGKPVDRRADMWAFGAVLYEMLTGRRAFFGEDVTDTIAAVVSKEPDWSALPADTPPSIRRLLKRCLDKDRKRRLDSALSARLDIDDAGHAAVSDTPARTAARLPWAIAALTGIALIAVAAIGTPWRAETPTPELRLDVATTDTDALSLFALSPDGRRIAYVARSQGIAQLWVRSLDSTDAQVLPETQGAGLPFWSPDGRSIGFISGGSLKRIDIAGGVPQTLAPAAVSRGGTWCADGVILYVPNATGTLMRVSAAGGNPEVVPLADPRHQSNRWPNVLPDGRRFLFLAQGPQEIAGIYLGSIDRTPPVRLTPASSNGVYLQGNPGWLLWVRGGSLVAQQLDLAGAKLTGDVVTIADKVVVQEVFGHSALAVSTTGVIAYRSGSTKRRQLTWFDRAGAVRGTFGEPSATVRIPQLSPDGGRVLVSRVERANEDVWMLDGTRDTRLTFDASNDALAVWAPDGRRIAFRSNRAGSGNIYAKAVGGAVAEEAITAASETLTPLSWSPDGRFLLHMATVVQRSPGASPGTAMGSDYNILATPMTGNDRTAIPLLASQFQEMWGVFSPGGRWLAYVSDHSGRNEVYVRPFVIGADGKADAPAEGQLQISSAGGNYPAWRRDGTELFFLAPTGEVMAASIAVNGTTLQSGVPVRLFRPNIFGGGIEVGLGRQYDVAPDGRFLVNVELDDLIEPIRVLLNWGGRQ